MGTRGWHYRQVKTEAEAQGGWLRMMPHHVAGFVPRGPRLLVTFDTMDAHKEPPPRKPWGYGFAAKAGYSHLGIMTKGRDDWYRHRAVLNFFDRMRDTGFFNTFDDVVFYGASMGGFAACTFVAAAPGARVVAISPQSTLLRARVPFERRYDAFIDKGDWDDPRYSDAATCLKLARSATVLVDPYHRLDCGHVARLPTKSLAVLPCAFMGHRIPRILVDVGGFGGVMRSVLKGQVQGEEWHAHLARRKTSFGYHKALSRAALARRHAGLATRVLQHAEALPGAHALPVLEEQIARLSLREKGQGIGPKAKQDRKSRR